MKNILKCQKAKYHQGICKIGKDKNVVKRIEDNTKKINSLLFDAKKDRIDPELLEIVVLRKKLPHFQFLTGRTKIKAVGDWKSPTGKSYKKEDNVILQIQFKDTKKEKIGKELTRRLKNLNRDLIGEELLYTRTIPVEETSL